MGKRTSHPPGTFSWVDLATTAVADAKSFYSGLFGWEAEESDAGGGAVYTTFRVEGDAVCGLFEMPEEMRSIGAPPSWTSYVTVADADASAARAEEFGGMVIRGPFDVADVGRMAILEDPQGAVFAVWQPGSRIGAERVNDLGCLCMNELATSDLDAERSFYESLFGWRTELIDTGPGEPSFVFAYNGETLNASFSQAEGDERPHWRPYFTVESTRSAMDRVLELGGTELMGPTDMVDGSIALAVDPQGAVFAFFAGEVDP